MTTFNKIVKKEYCGDNNRSKTIQRTKTLVAKGEK